MPMIRLPYGNNEFNSDELKKYIRGIDRSYIIQGQTNCRRDNHPKPSSLDCWLRDNYDAIQSYDDALKWFKKKKCGCENFPEGEVIFLLTSTEVSFSFFS